MNENQKIRPAMVSKYFTSMGIVNLKPMQVAFHMWAEEPAYESSMLYKRCFGIVESIEGKIYKVPPETVEFIK